MPAADALRKSKSTGKIMAESLRNLLAGDSMIDDARISDPLCAIKLLISLDSVIYRSQFWCFPLVAYIARNSY
jgi:hypothetical protein